MERLPELMKQRRKLLGLSQGETAELSGVSERFVREVESGKSSMQLDKLEALLDALGLQLEITARQT